MGFDTLPSHHGKVSELVILWMDEILDHFETMRNHCLLVFTGESSFPGFLGGAAFRSSTVSPGYGAVLFPKRAVGHS